ncbi:MAG: hypothetical protein HEEMFOPI_00863 [Holosporales bacterium]
MEIESFFFKAKVQNAKVLGINEFGASGKAEDLYTHFGLTPQKIVEEVLEMVDLKPSFSDLN